MYIHAHIYGVHFTWDPRKSARNATDRGFDFAFAALIFTGPTVGRAAPAVLTVVYTDRVATDGTIERRIISARVSTRRERQVYQAAYPEV